MSNQLSPVLYQLTFWDEESERVVVHTYEDWAALVDSIVAHGLRPHQFSVVMGDLLNVRVQDCVEVSLGGASSVVPRA